MKTSSMLSSFSLLLLVSLFWVCLTPSCSPVVKPSEKSSGDAGPVEGKPEAKTFTKLSAAGFTTVSDVTIHNKVGQDIGDLQELFAASPIDWTKAHALYEKGKHSVKSDGSVRTLNGFASSPDNFKKYSPEASAFFKDKGICQLSPVSGFACTEGKFVDEFVEAYALKGTGPFEKAGDKARAAAVLSGIHVLMGYWVRLELGKALEKVKDGNLEPTKGAPHNWDEGFAFYWGPEGKHSLFALAAELSSKYKLATSINDNFFKSMIAGQKMMLDDKKAPTEAVSLVGQQLLRLYLLAALDAGKELDAAGDEEAKAAARWRGFGYWLGMGHAIAKADATAATTFADVFFSKKIEKDAYVALKEAVSKALGGLGMKAEDFGDALK